MDNLINSAIGTAFAELLTLPICTIKTNYQNTNSNSIIKTMNSMYKTGGIKIFYAASLPAIGGQIFSTSSKYFLYQHFQTKFPNNNKFVNGFSAGIISSLFTHPLDMIKIHKQMNASVNDEIRKSGLRVLYRGYSKTFVKIGVSSMLFFPLFDTFNEKMENALLASFCSSVCATIVMHPIDYLKTRHIYNLSLYESIIPRRGNYFPMYKGIGLNLLRIVPHFMVTMTIIDYLSGLRSREESRL